MNDAGIKEVGYKEEIVLYKGRKHTAKVFDWDYPDGRQVRTWTITFGKHAISVKPLLEVHRI